MSDIKEPETRNRPKRLRKDGRQTFNGLLELDQISIHRGIGYSKVDLIKICRSLSISSRGLKVELALRIKDYFRNLPLDDREIASRSHLKV
jgi:hypothetical protein